MLHFLITHPYFTLILCIFLTWASNALGSCFVFFLDKLSDAVNSLVLGFASGVMFAACIWSLLVPAMEQAAQHGSPLIPAVGGFLIGAFFLYLLDKIIPHIHKNTVVEGIPTPLKKSILMVLAVTIHNIPEGLAVGIAFGAALGTADGPAILSALALALGLALQNVPEGAATAFALRGDGFSRKKSFFYGQLSGIVEPVAAVFGVFIAQANLSVMPWFLSFAAGAMMYIIVEELIPESQSTQHTHAATFGTLFGFILMMVLDVALG